ncbi:uncharacterized protein LOC142930506 [Petromyzon marinus]|uniref:uncharacterized protein LOC142930506 n=1 Tax=Petromyzon marinus TaxID=7757 RepID=UPI003F713D67
MPRVSSSSSSRRSWGVPLLWVACCICSVRAHLEVQLSEGPITYASLGGSVSITCHYRRVHGGSELAPDATPDDDDPPGWAAGDVPEVRFGVVGRNGVRRSDVAAARGLETLVQPALVPRASLATDGGGPWGGAATLTLSGLLDADAGLYVCEVALASGSARATTRLLVDGKAGRPAGRRGARVAREWSGVLTSTTQRNASGVHFGRSLAGIITGILMVQSLVRSLEYPLVDSLGILTGTQAGNLMVHSLVHSLEYSLVHSLVLPLLHGQLGGTAGVTLMPHSNKLLGSIPYSGTFLCCPVSFLWVIWFPPIVKIYTM